MALDYAVWHLTTMTPAHDERSSIAAKGLTGEGYKGHVFWDTEIFLLPFHLFTRPQIARSLLRYRWLNLAGAREKARRNGWPGALFPWESAASGLEETPEFAAINIRTGYVRRWPPRWRNTTSWRTSPGPSSLTGRRRMMMPLCVMKV
jgi:hypothetical glycosyl hydrolase